MRLDLSRLAPARPQGLKKCIERNPHSDFARAVAGVGSGLAAASPSSAASSPPASSSDDATSITSGDTTSITSGGAAGGVWRYAVR